MNYIIIIISILILLFFFFKIIGIQIKITKSKFEDRSKIKVINNSYLNTFKDFVSQPDYDYLTGKVIFFNTWASWCGSCIKEIPILNQLQSSYKFSEKIVFISYCNDIDTRSIPEFLQKRNLELNYRFLTSREGLRVSLMSILSEYPNPFGVDPSIDSVPWNFIVDQNEKVLYFKRGMLQQEDILVITSILNKF